MARPAMRKAASLQPPGKAGPPCPPHLLPRLHPQRLEVCLVVAMRAPDQHVPPHAVQHDGAEPAWASEHGAPCHGVGVHGKAGHGTNCMVLVAMVAKCSTGVARSWPLQACCWLRGRTGIPACTLDTPVPAVTLCLRKARLRPSDRDMQAGGSNRKKLLRWQPSGWGQWKLGAKRAGQGSRACLRVRRMASCSSCSERRWWSITGHCKGGAHGWAGARVEGRRDFP